MRGNRTALIIGAGCLLAILCLAVAVPASLIAVNRISNQAGTHSQDLGAGATAVVEQAVPVPLQVTPGAQDRPQQAQPPAQPPQQPGVSPNNLTALYNQINPGVVSIRVQISQGPFSGEAAGSGFILDNDGHIATNNHVVADANRVTVVFYNGIEIEGQVVGTDADSDLAVIRVDRLADGAHPLPVGNSDAVQPGEWVVAVGNPFQFAGSMTVGIVSAIGRAIPSLTPQFSIPQAIQTDAAINPGNSGGPLLNLNGEVIGVNDQIRTSDGIRANAGVGFAIPSNIVSLVVPSLIDRGSYTWPWIGVSSDPDLTPLLIQEANNFDTQQGAYIVEVIQDSPADEAGLQGAPQTRTVNGVSVRVGGDLIVEADGQPIRDFNDLLVSVAFKQPGDTMTLTYIRNGQRHQTTVTLEARPATIPQQP